MKQSTLKLGVFTVMLPDLTPEEAVTELRASGYDGVEWRVTTTPAERRNEAPSFWGNNLCTLEPTAGDTARGARLAREVGLELVGLTTYLPVGDLDAAENALYLAELAGASHIRVGPGSPDGGYYAAFERATAYLREVERLARYYGVKALVETHQGTITPSASLAHRLVSPFDPEYIGVLYDPGNLVFEGFENYRLGLELLGPHLAHVHLKNARFVRGENGVWQPEWSPLGDGAVDFRGLLDALRGVGYDGWLVVEDFSAARPGREALRHNLNFVRSLLESVPA